MLLRSVAYFFADDSFLFFKANHLEAKTVKEILDNYAKASGQANQRLLSARMSMWIYERRSHMSLE